jgi:hypothetical protein
MNIRFASILAVFGTTAICLSQSVENGLVPVTDTFYVNTNYTQNGSSESLGVTIAANGNVLIGWEDDGAGIQDFEAAWTLFDGTGAMLTPETTITNYDASETMGWRCRSWRTSMWTREGAGIFRWCNCWGTTAVRCGL